MRGMGGVYEHVTPETKQRILDVLTSRWESSLLALRAQEQERLVATLPKMEQTIARLRASREVQEGQVTKMIAQISPKHS
jgi:hypothetical protein